MPSDSDPDLGAQALEAHDFKHLIAVADDDLLAQLRRFLGQGIDVFAPKTRQAWHYDSQVFSAWCTAHGRRALPASPQTIAEFLEDMARPIEHDGYGRATSTVERYHATLTWMHRAAGVADNPCADTAVLLALRSIKRMRGVARRQKDPLTWEVIARALADANERLRERFDAALVCVGYDTMGRAEDLRHMHVDHLAFNANGTGTVYIPRGKTDQQGEGWVGFLSATTVVCVRTWIAAAWIQRGYLFRAVDNAGNVGSGEQAMSAAAVTRAFKRVAIRAGADPANIAGHSARIGACHDLTSAGFALPQVMEVGRWRSPIMPTHYSRHINAEDGPMAELARLQQR